MNGRTSNVKGEKDIKRKASPIFLQIESTHGGTQRAWKKVKGTLRESHGERGDRQTLDKKNLSSLDLICKGKRRESPDRFRWERERTPT